MAAAVEFRNVVKKFPGASYNALDHVDLQIEEGALVTVLGTSGCGKTTLIKLINRIYEPDEGEILLSGKNIQQIDPITLRRGIGYVIQQIGLFPHMTIYENIATVPKILKWDKDRIDARVAELLRLVDLPPEEFQTRYPRQLSGGQQQRVGLIRALAADPSLMLFDEPFGAIDAINRANLQDELLRIHRQSNKTFVFVTHDVGEALKLGTRVLIMDHGAIQQYAAPEEILAHPANAFVEALIRTGRQESEGAEG
ncbi:MAG: ABC transporter ATP-binding protein [Oscillospiraceae bacterium]|nr:ABC transporter ATP-binding protein [Oscillospiraceae bacterium]MBQ9045830.1 ABC transporter ATP-binding protein [Oscillospiraceae bacterium]